MDLAKTGRGKWAKKPVPKSRFLERDSSDVEKESVPLHPAQRGGARAGAGRKPAHKSTDAVCSGWILAL